MSSNFYHEVTTEKKPWTHLNFGDRGDGLDFCFGIVSDRAGRPRPGVFEKAIEHFNRLHPDFVMSVGDFVEGVSVEDQSVAFLKRQWRRIKPEIEKSAQPFFYVAGNHDYSPPEHNFPLVEAHERQSKIWNDMFGVSYYFFIYKNTLFLCLNSQIAETGLGWEQTKWAIDVLKRYANVRWTFVFLHSPYYWDTDEFKALEKELYERNYTVFTGDLHQYTKYVRYGRKYFMLGMTGCGEVLVGQGPRGVHFGEFDHITWVSMFGNRPAFTNLALDGIYDEDVVTTEKITWLTAKYFRGNKKISHKEALRLRKLGIDIEETEF